MATGDNIACQQILEQLGGIERVVVKKGTGRYSAECLPSSVAQALIEECAKRAVHRLLEKDTQLPFKLGIPIKLTVELQSSDMADRAMLIPGVARKDRTLFLIAEDMPKAYSAFRAIVLLSYPR